MNVHLEPYDPRWSDDFVAIRERLATALGSLAVRIDHIGSTSIPGMAAKDVIDVQVAVASLEQSDEITARISHAGFEQRPYGFDHAPPGSSDDVKEWMKLFFRTSDGERRAHIHVRTHGRANFRYALLFRDYVRAHPEVVTVWVTVKSRLAERFPHDSATYADVKDPITDLLMLAAERWASDSGWSP